MFSCCEQCVENFLPCNSNYQDTDKTCYSSPMPTYQLFKVIAAPSIQKLVGSNRRLTMSQDSSEGAWGNLPRGYRIHSIPSQRAFVHSLSIVQPTDADTAPISGSHAVCKCSNTGCISNRYPSKAQYRLHCKHQYRFHGTCRCCIGRYISALWMFYLPNVHRA